MKIKSILLFFMSLSLLSSGESFAANVAREKSSKTMTAGTCDPISNLESHLDKIELATPLRNGWETYISPVVFAFHKNGNGWVGWGGSDEKVHLTPVDVNFKRTSSDLILPFLTVYALVAHSNGTVAALVGAREGGTPVNVGMHPKWPSSLYIVRYDATGKELMRTHLRGGKGFTPDPNNPEHVRTGGITWFLPTDKASLVYDGTGYGAYFLIARHFLVGGVHQSDEYVEVSYTGTETKRYTWIGSHTFFVNQAVTSDARKVGVGEVHPKQPHLGIVFHNWETGSIKKFAWPALPSEVAAVDKLGFPGTIGSFFRVGKELIVTTASYVADQSTTLWDKTKWYPRLIRLDENGKLLSSKQLSNTSIATQAQVFLYAAPFGKGQVLAVWSDFQKSLYSVPTCTVGVFDYKGKEVVRPIPLKLPVNYNMQLGSVSSGDVAWIYANAPLRDRLTIMRWRAPKCLQTTP